LEAAEVASAGRSCLAIIVVVLVIALLLCVGLAGRWLMGR
jgi:hypothetical protein